MKYEIVVLLFKLQSLGHRWKVALRSHAAWCHRAGSTGRVNGPTVMRLGAVAS